jgi:general secretion pathway protein M
MIKSKRETIISVLALGALLVFCASVVALSLQARSNAAYELYMQKELLARLSAHAGDHDDAKPKSGAVAPAAAFLSAPTQGLAGAQLQAYVQQTADSQHATLNSSGLEVTRHDDKPDSIRLQAALDMNLPALQAILYQLESGTPYVFVDSLNVQLLGGGSQGPAEDPLLRITLGLRAIWRRGNT